MGLDRIPFLDALKIKTGFDIHFNLCYSYSLRVGKVNFNDENSIEKQFSAHRIWTV